MKHFSNQVLTSEVDLTILDGSFAITAASGLAGSPIGWGISTITHAATGDTGKYVITLADKYNKLVGFNPTVVASSFSNVAVIEVAADDIAASGSITVQCYDLSGAAVDPASGSTIKFEIVVRQSSVKCHGE